MKKTSTGATSNALVDSFADGQVEQFATGTAATLSNNGTAEHGAIAHASNAAGDATATATAVGVLWQYGGGPTENLSIVNNGSWLFDASASAVASGLTGDASASAHLNDAMRALADVPVLVKSL